MELILSSILFVVIITAAIYILLKDVHEQNDEGIYD